jgi:leucyl aminopeptidase
MVVVEAARVMLESGYSLNRPVYFIWYAAEEVGLVGSREVVKFAKANNWSVDSVLHFDTVGRRAKADDATLWFLRDNVDNDFTDYVAKLVEQYVKLPVDYTTCGYACSDHASWTDGGFVSAAAVESSFADLNPYLHTTEDTMEKVSIDNLVNYTKLALAYVVDRSAS